MRELSADRLTEGVATNGWRKENSLRLSPAAKSTSLVEGGLSYPTSY